MASHGLWLANQFLARVAPHGDSGEITDEESGAIYMKEVR